MEEGAWSLNQKRRDGSRSQVRGAGDILVRWFQGLPAAGEALSLALRESGVRDGLDSAGLLGPSRWVLPRLLWLPVQHGWQLVEALETLELLAEEEGDREDLASTLSLLSGLKVRLLPFSPHSPEAM